MSQKVSFFNFMVILCAAVLASAFFWSLVLLDKAMQGIMSPSQRIAMSHFFLALIILLILALLPGGGLANWGLNFKNWSKNLVSGLILGISVGILFSLFSYGGSISGWHFSQLAAQLNKKETLIMLFSQLVLVGTSEELFFRGLLTTWLMKRYPSRLVGLSVGVVIVAILFVLVQLYKLLFGFPLGKVLVFMLGALFYGLLLGGIYQKTKSLLAPIIIHNVGNSVMFLVGLGF